MARRLTEMYRPGDRVEIYFKSRPETESGWQVGTVVDLDHPGVWVVTEDGARWFVTNRRRIRPAER